MGKVKVGFIGAGGIASVHLKNVANNKDAVIVAICDISSETAQAQAEAYSATPYTDYNKMLENERLDAVFVSVPPFAHGDIEEKVVEKGIHILVEKPLELDIKKAQAKYEVIKNSGVIHASGYCLRYLDTYQKAKEYLADKKIAMVRGYYLTSFVHTPWYRIKNKSGGQLVEQSTHIMDAMLYFAGDVTQVQADMSLQVSGDIEGIDVPDVSSVNVRYASGAVGHLDSTFTQHDHRMGLEILGRDFRLEINGTALSIIEKGQTTTYQSNVDFYEVQDRAFIEAVKTKNQTLILSSYEDGLKTLAITLAANHSDEIRQTVLIEEFN